MCHSIPRATIRTRRRQMSKREDKIKQQWEHVLIKSGSANSFALQLIGEEEVGQGHDAGTVDWTHSTGPSMVETPQATEDQRPLIVDSDASSSLPARAIALKASGWQRLRNAIRSGRLRASVPTGSPLFSAGSPLVEALPVSPELPAELPPEMPPERPDSPGLPVDLPGPVDLPRTEFAAPMPFGQCFDVRF